MIRIRQMDYQDCAGITEVAQKCIANAWPLSSFEESFMQEATVYYVAETDHEIIGFVGLLVGMEQADILDIAVLEKYRKQQIGMRLLQKILGDAAQKNVQAIYLEVRSSNHTARQFYENAGFMVEGVRKKYYRNPVENALIMRKSLESFEKH